MKKLLAVVGAVAAGFAAGILTAPKSGKETREDLMRKADEYKGEAEKRADQAKVATKESVDSIKSGAKKVSEAAVETARDVKGKVEQNFKDAPKK